MRIHIRESANRLRAVPRVASQRRSAPPADERQKQAAMPGIDFSPVHGRHCICDRCQAVRAARLDRDAA
jgi:hypothetical protein